MENKCNHDEGFFPDGNCAKCDYVSYSEVIEELQKENKKLKSCVEECLYFTAMRDPEINTHKQACDTVEEICSKTLKVIPGNNVYKE